MTICPAPSLRRRALLHRRGSRRRGRVRRPEQGRLVPFSAPLEKGLVLW